MSLYCKQDTSPYILHNTEGREEQSRAGKSKEEKKIHFKMHKSFGVLSKGL